MLKSLLRYRLVTFDYSVDYKTGKKDYIMLLYLAPLGAFIPALFFQGHNPPWFCAALIILLLWLARLLQQRQSLPLPGSVLPPVLLLWWIWLAATMLWTQAPAITDYNLWRAAALPIGYLGALWLPQPQRFWHYARPVATAVVIMLCSYALLQHLWLGQSAAATFANQNNLAAMLHLLGFMLIAHWWQRHSQTQPSAHLAHWLLTAGFLLLLGFTSGAIGSRGAFWAAVAAFALLSGVFIHQYRQWRPCMWTGVWYTLGTTLAALPIWHGEGSLLSLHALERSQGSRLLIWQGAWDMWQQAPPWGIGFGTFWLHYPAHRLAAEKSAGFFAHNDYLQLLIEGGYPALLLTLAIGISLIALWLRRLKDSQQPAGQKLEMTALFAGIAAVCAHSLVTFNLYILPILIPLGLVLGRFHQLSAGPQTSRTMHFPPWLRPKFRNTLIGLIVLFPILHLGSVGWTEYHLRRIDHQDIGEKFIQIHHNLKRITSLWPWQDYYWIQHADVLRKAIQLLPPDKQQQKQKLFNLALAKLHHAQQLNPLRPQAYYFNALLLLENKAMASKNSISQARQALQQAVQLDPRFFKARLLLAGVLMHEEQPQQALTLLEHGLKQARQEGRVMLPYYRLTAKLRSQQGNLPGARRMYNKAEEHAAALAQTASAKAREEKLEKGILDKVKEMVSTGE